MAAVTRLSRPVRSSGRAVGIAGEEMVKHPSFYAQVLVEVFTRVRIYTKYRSVICNLVSDITIGAEAMIVGGGMVFVIFSMSFFTGTEVGLQGFKGLEQIGAEGFTGLIGAFANTREVTPLIAGVAFAARSEEHTSAPVTNAHLVCRLLLEKKKNHNHTTHMITTI